MEPEDSYDELWDKAQTDEGTPSVDDETDELETEATVEDGSLEATDETPDETDDPQFEEELFARFRTRFEREVLPTYRDEWTKDVMNRTRQSQKARETEIQKQLAPLWNLLSRQAQEGNLLPEDAQREYAKAYQQVSQEREQQEEQQRQVSARQQWLAQQQAQAQQSAQYQRPDWADPWEKHFDNIMERSGLEEGDPELKYVPLQLTDLDPRNALELFKSGVETAVAAKQARLKNESRRPKPFIDMGGGGSSGAGNPLAGIEDPDQLWQIAMQG